MGVSEDSNVVARYPKDLLDHEKSEICVVVTKDLSKEKPYKWEINILNVDETLTVENRQSTNPPQIAVQLFMEDNGIPEKYPGVADILDNVSENIEE